MSQPPYSFHDGSVDGILVSGKDAKVFLRDVSGSCFTMALSGVERLKVDDFREGNIILRLSMLAGGKCDADLIRDLYEPSEHDRGADEFLSRLQERVNNEKLVLVEITPSYGCSLLALCAEVRTAPEVRWVNLDAG
jgi:hypothetical protein